jgi:hypothetical protein
MPAFTEHYLWNKSGLPKDIYGYSARTQFFYDKRGRPTTATAAFMKRRALAGVVYNTGEGNWGEAAIGAISVIPVGSVLGKAAKGAKQQFQNWLVYVKYQEQYGQQLQRRFRDADVRISKNGGVIFTGTKYNFKAANAKAGFTKTPNNYTWHHVDDFNPTNGRASMELVERDAHKATTPHKGSVGQYQDYHGVKYKK